MDNDFIVIQLEQRSQAWKEFRKGKIGASQVAAIMGLNPWVTKLQVWEEIAYGKEKEINENMERGVRLEAEALEWFNKDQAAHYTPIVIQSKKHPFLIASLDGYWEGQIVELKAPKRFSNEVPVYYHAQIQHQLFVSGAQVGWYVEYVEGKGSVCKVERDKLFIEGMLKKELAFLESIKNNVAPEPEEKDWVEETDVAKLMDACRYTSLEEMIEALQEEQRGLRERLIKQASHNRVKLGNLKMSKVMRRGNICYKDIVEELLPTMSGSQMEKYRGDGIESWRFYS